MQAEPTVAARDCRPSLAGRVHPNFGRAALSALASGALLLAACSPKPAPTANESMSQVMQPEAQTIWDITSRAFNEKGDGLVPSKISTADWIKLARSGRRLRDRARVLAAAQHVVVATDQERIMGQSASHQGVRRTWDAASPEQIQALIDAHPELFARRAQILAEAGDTVLNAANAKDAARLYAVSSNLDEVCDGCHERFWGTDDPPPFPH
jgi:hypothetical protein